MELKDIVCDFEYAVELSNLGVGSYKSSLFFYDSAENLTLWKNTTCPIFTNTYTVAELGEMLPKEINFCHEKHDIQFFKMGNRKSYYHSRLVGLKHCMDVKEANSRAKLLIWLIENNLVNVEELNNGE